MGQSSYVAASLQTAEGTAAATAQHFPPVQTSGLEPNREAMDYAETVGSRAPVEQAYGGIFYEGDTEGAVRLESIAPFLTSAFGPPTSVNKIGVRANTTAYVLGDIISVSTRLYSATTGGTSAAAPPGGLGSTTTGQTVTDGTVVWTDQGSSTGVTIYEHTWDPTAPGKNPKPMTFWTINQDESPALVDKYIDCYVNEMGLSVETNGYFVFTAALQAIQCDQTAAAPALTRDLTQKVPFHQITAQMSVAGAALAPTTLASVEFNWNNNIATDLYGLGSVKPRTFRAGTVESTLNFRVLDLLTSHYRRVRKASPEFVRILLTAIGEQISGSINRQLSFDVKRLQYLEGPAPIDASEVMTGIDISANAVIDPGNQVLVIKMLNTNTGATYQ